MTRLLYLMLFFSSISTGHAFGELLFIVKGPGSPKENNLIIEQFTSQLSSSLNGKTIGYIQASEASMLSGNDKIVIALGEESLSEILRGSGNSPVIAVFISRTSYDDVISGALITRPITAIYSNPSPFRQVALIKSLLGEGASVGVISSPQISKAVKDAVSAANFLGVKVKVVNLDKRQTPKALLELLKETRTLLLQKDRDIFRVIPLDTLLLLAYDINNMGIVGYSSGVVKNGALATTYTSLNDTVTSVASLVTKMVESGTVPEAGYSDTYSVLINKYVVRSLELHEKDAKTIKKDIQNLLEGK